MMEHEKPFDVIVIGAGHAGTEAALAAARMGLPTLLLTLSMDTIGQMSCNPAIGGLAKGQMVREIDALGGTMARAIDAAGIQFKMLNTSKGPAVRSPRAQADRTRYRLFIKNTVESQPGLSVRQENVDRLLVEQGRAAGVLCKSGFAYRAPAVIVTTGTFMRGLIHQGEVKTAGGRTGEPATTVSDSLRELGFRLLRLKTGTPPRLNGRTVDFGRLTPQPGDDPPVPFSYDTVRIPLPQVPCHLTHTNPRTHAIIRANLHRAPMYNGQITAVGPRYCPSVETKIDRFAGKERHSVFLEPEGLDTRELYVNGLSTSLPADVQEEMVRSIAGLERAEITRHGYAVEYDSIDPTQIRPTMESRAVPGLYLAGQICGTSGYEEAAGQGLMAGINAGLQRRGLPPLVLGRHEAYIGVMIDDLVTRGVDEPYRMFTSRAEYRLLLRNDNADRRLLRHGHRVGLVSDGRLARLQEKEDAVVETRAFLERTAHQGKPLAQWLRNPAFSLADLEALNADLARRGLTAETREQVEIEVKYEGYLQRHLQEIERHGRLEVRPLPEDLDYTAVRHLRFEAREQLTRFRPLTIGQASRLSGISPADISVLLIHLGRGE